MRTNLNHMIFSAFRYALGRATYIVHMTTDFIKNNTDLLTENDMKLMIKEITEAEERDWLGWEMDKVEWLSLRDFLKAKITTKNV